MFSWMEAIPLTARISWFAVQAGLSVRLDTSNFRGPTLAADFAVARWSGLASSPHLHPALTRWANEFRRYAAGLYQRRTW